MREDLVVTLIGVDRPGLVEAVSSAVTRYHGNWEASRMARMAGRFAGILRVSVAAEHARDLEEALRGLESLGLRVVVERGVAADETGTVGAKGATAMAGAEATRAASRTARIELVGNDRPGVIRTLSGALAERGVNIVELETETRSAPMTGDSLLEVRAEIALPPGLALDDLRRTLETLLSDFMVDVS